MSEFNIGDRVRVTRGTGMDMVYTNIDGSCRYVDSGAHEVGKTGVVLAICDRRLMPEWAGQTDEPQPHYVIACESVGSPLRHYTEWISRQCHDVASTTRVLTMNADRLALAPRGD